MLVFRLSNAAVARARRVCTTELSKRPRVRARASRALTVWARAGQLADARILVLCAAGPSLERVVEAVASPIPIAATARATTARINFRRKFTACRSR